MVDFEDDETGLLTAIRAMVIGLAMIGTVGTLLLLGIMWIVVKIVGSLG